MNTTAWRSWTTNASQCLLTQYDNQIAFRDLRSATFGQRRSSSLPQRRCSICGAAGKQNQLKPSGQLTSKKAAKRPANTVTTKNDDTVRWNFFSVEEYNKPWQVPWGKQETAFGFLAWILTFLLTSLLTIPVVINLTGIPIQNLTSQQKTEYVLLNQLLETVLGIAVIRYTLRNFNPLPADIFQVAWKDPFAKPRGWLLWALLGILLAPILVSLTLGICTALGYTDSGPSTVDEVVKIIAPDTLTFASLFAVTAVLAPVLEEYVFRGFLLTSLTKFLPVPGAVFVSSLGFGAAHLSVKDFPELTVLGMLLGFSYVRSRNLLTPIAIHGLWNGTVLTALYAAAQLQQQLPDASP